MSTGGAPKAGGRVVVGYDGSPDARSAVAWAARTALALRARLQVVHVVGLLEYAGMGAARLVDGDDARSIATREGMAPDDVEWCRIDGDPCSALLRMAQPAGAALLVVGSRGAGAHAGTLLGSTSLKLAERARVPVAIVPWVSGSA
jgi:nucleotide-binding universal stress UspA family protein